MRDESAEIARILRAAADRTIHTNDAGRWLIDGEKTRPDRKAREKAFARGWIDWTWENVPRGQVGYRLTEEGGAALKLMESR